MRVGRRIAIAVLGTLLPLADHAVAQAAEPACEAKPIAAARKAAQARRDTGDPAGAWTILKPFVDLGCFGEADARPGPGRRMLSDYAWLLNDAYVDGADKRFARGAPESETCVDLLQPLADDGLVPHAWMSPALRQATVANIKACAKGCGPSLNCVPFRANAWAAHMSLAATFRPRACKAGLGQALDDGRCIELRGGKAGFGFTWQDAVKTDSPTEADERAYCPALYLHAPGKQAVRLELPEESALRQASFCCAEFAVEMKPGTDEFMISSRDAVHECAGGTARRIVEEIYRLAPTDRAPALVRDNGMGLH